MPVEENKGKINFILHFDLVKLFKLLVHKTHRKGEKGTQFAVLWYISLQRTEVEGSAVGKF